jgi:hypothetical protein
MADDLGGVGLLGEIQVRDVSLNRADTSKESARLCRQRCQAGAR